MRGDVEEHLEIFCLFKVERDFKNEYKLDLFADVSNGFTFFPLLI